MSNFSIENTTIHDCYVLKTPTHQDERGIFKEWFKPSELFPFNCEQANFSFSNKNVLRGMHYSIGEFSQAKVVTCVSGSFMDVLLDVREDSPTYMNVFTLEASAHSGIAVYVAPGVAHGFLALDQGTGVVYLTSQPYHRASERSINALDPHLSHVWGLDNPLRSEADIKAPYLDQRP